MWSLKIYIFSILTLTVMNLPLFLPPLVTFALTLIGIFFIRRFFPQLGLMDRPHEYGLSRPPVPYSAGIIFFIVFLVSAFLFTDITKPVAGVIFAGLLITIVSFLDDRFRLSPVLRLAAQVFASIIVVLGGVKIQLIQNPFGSPVFLDTIQFSFLGQSVWLFSAIVITAWLILMMNVMNWLDGIPGLASGISTIAQISIFLLSWQKFNAVDQTAVQIFSLTLAASTLAFLFFDFARPKILMGDTGSMFLGFMLGSLSILAGGKLATALLIMGFPVLDAIFVILRRVSQKKSPLKGDFSHFHHRLLHIGISPKKALLVNYFFCALFAVIALSLKSSFTKFIAFATIVAIAVAISLMIFSYERKKSL